MLLAFGFVVVLLGLIELLVTKDSNVGHFSVVDVFVLFVPKSKPFIDQPLLGQFRP